MIDLFRALEPTLQATFKDGRNPLNNQVIATFQNGYGASIVQGPYTHGGPEGLFEVGVLDQNGHLTYDTPITSDVIGYLDSRGVIEILLQIQALEAE